MTASKLRTLEARLTGLETDLQSFAKRLLSRLGEELPVKAPKAVPTAASKKEAVLVLKFSEMSVTQAAQALLEERNNEPMHFRDMAEDALSRGYTSGRDVGLDTIADSFWHLMRRKPEKFELKGKGFFCLKG